MFIFDFCLYFLFTFCLVFYSIYFCFVKRFDQLWKGTIVSIVFIVYFFYYKNLLSPVWKADSKIDQLDLLEVAVVFISFISYLQIYLYLFIFP